MANTYARADKEELDLRILEGTKGANNTSGRGDAVSEGRGIEGGEMGHKGA